MHSSHVISPVETVASGSDPLSEAVATARGEGVCGGGAVALPTPRQNQALRFSLTEKCNFKCIFCHNEGLDPEQLRPAEDSRADQVLRDAVASGYTDITFTGGEPLLELPRLERFLRLLGDLPRPPRVTLVTNGLLLRARALAALKRYPGAKKIHVSLHAAEPAVHAEVTQTASSTFRRVCQNVEGAVADGRP